MVNINLTNFIIGFIITLTAAVLLTTAITDLSLEYGSSEPDLYYQDSGSMFCPVNGTIESLNKINSLFQNQSLDSVTYAPGQENAPVGTNLVTATQTGGLVATLKLVGLVMIMPKTITTDLGCAIGLPPMIIIALQTVFMVIILMLIAGLFYFRKV